METYFKFKFFKDFIILVVLILLFILYIIYSIVKFKIDKVFKKNCFECKEYILYNVESCGDGCTYKCNKFNRLDSRNANDRYNLVRCNNFKGK